GPRKSAPGARARFGIVTTRRTAGFRKQESVSAGAWLLRPTRWAADACGPTTPRPGRTTSSSRLLLSESERRRHQTGRGGPAARLAVVLRSCSPLTTRTRSHLGRVERLHDTA